MLDKTIAIELHAMSNGGKGVLDKVAPGLKLVDSTALFNEIRMIKSPWEIEHLRKVLKSLNMVLPARLKNTGRVYGS